MAAIFNIAIDAQDPSSLARFWSKVTGYALSFESDDLVRLSAPNSPFGPHLIFLRVNQPTPGKNKIHLDLSDDPPAEAARLVSLGARPVDELDLSGALNWREANGLQWVVLADPESNLFCLGSNPA